MHSDYQRHQMISLGNMAGTLPLGAENRLASRAGGHTGNAWLGGRVKKGTRSRLEASELK